MKSYNMDIVKQNMLMTSELIKVMKLLEDNEIEAIAFKGPTLAHMAYGDITLRQYSDLDILIKKDDLYNIEYLLQKINIHAEIAYLDIEKKIWFKHNSEFCMLGNNNVSIELHRFMFDTDHPISLSNIDFFNNKKILIINSKNINIMSNEIFIIYLCIHGSKHLFERLEWIIDIDRFIRNQIINWDIVDNIILNSNYKRFFYLGLYSAHILFNTELPKKYNNSFNDINILKTFKYIQYTLNSKKITISKNKIRYMLKLFCSIEDKLKYLHKRYFKPSINDYNYIKLPSYLYFIYYFIRQYLLFKTYIINKHK